jgi:hypothetical protein
MRFPPNFQHLTQNQAAGWQEYQPFTEKKTT